MGTVATTFTIWPYGITYICQGVKTSHYNNKQYRHSLKADKTSVRYDPSFNLSKCYHGVCYFLIGLHLLNGESTSTERKSALADTFLLAYHQSTWGWPGKGISLTIGGVSTTEKKWVPGNTVVPPSDQISWHPSCQSTSVVVKGKSTVLWLGSAPLTASGGAP